MTVGVLGLLTEVQPTSMIIGDATPDGNTRYAVANETLDIIRVDKMLTLFDLNHQ